VAGVSEPLVSSQALLDGGERLRIQTQGGEHDRQATPDVEETRIDALALQRAASAETPGLLQEISGGFEMPQQPKPIRFQADCLDGLTSAQLPGPRAQAIETADLRRLAVEIFLDGPQL